MRILASPYLETIELNPVQSLLYRSMENLGVEVAGFSGRRLLFEQWDIWHLHWPESIVNEPNASRVAVRLLKFWAKLKLARIRNMKIFWTVHNLRPHDRDHPLLEQIFWHMFLPNVDGLICMSESGKQQLYRQHVRARAHPVYVIPHGHYRGVYPDSMSREHARRALRSSQMNLSSPSSAAFGRTRAFPN